ncbi:MAG: M48 family metalloprotease [Armatimonadetes bacterium]|nr:M48 family metalloprotease [Armatimonadota bacterium]
MASDIEMDGVSLGEWINRELRADCFFETDGWAMERVRRVNERLQQDRPPETRFIVEVPWMDETVAFTSPGRYVYFSRRLLELCDDEAAAFVIAHEIAHHDLGHLDILPDWIAKMGRSLHLGGAILGSLFLEIEKRIYGPENECAADRHALDLCLAAGYDGLRCLAVFDHLERDALDRRDLDIVYGPDPSDDELDENAGFNTRLKIWFWQRSRGYLPIRDRRAMLLKRLQSLEMEASVGRG